MVKHPLKTIAQNQQLHKESSAPLRTLEEALISGEPSFSDHFSLLHLHQPSMASNDIVAGHTSGSGSGSDAEQNKIAPSPNRTSYGNITPQKRRSPSSYFTPMPESSDSDAECRRLLSQGFRVLPLPSADNERTDSSPLRRTLSLTSTGSSSVSQSEFLNHGVLIPPENLARRSLFPSPAIGQASAAHMLPPPHPLSRTTSDPVQFSNLEYPMAMTRERNPVPRTGSYASSGVLVNGLGFDSTQQTSSCKRPNSKIHKRNMKQKMMAWINQMPDDEDDDNEQINVSIPKTDNQVIVDGNVNVNVGIYNNGVSSADQNTIANAESEGPQEAQLGNEEIKEEEDDVESEADLVKARREGDFTFLEFECRCGSSYSIGIIGESCFYKLV